MESLLADIRHGLRILRQNLGFTTIAVLTLALGIGANTAIFSVVDGVLLNPLPYPHPDQLVALHESKPNFDRGSISYPNFRDWQKDNHTFSCMAMRRSYAFSLTGMGEAEQVNAEFVSADFFSVLGVKPVIGRGFQSGEDNVGAAAAAVVSAGFWKRKFGSSPEALGKSLTLDGKPYTIVGVVPAGVDLLASSSPPEIYVPIGQWNNNLLLNRSAGLGIHGIGRLKAGVSIEQARADMDAVSRNLAAAFPKEDKGIGASIVPLKDQLVGKVRPFLLVLLGAVGFVLLIACVNVANLLLARSTGRNREFAIRAALGASRTRVIRQLLTESAMLAALGGGLGLLLASWGTRAALSVLPTALPRAREIGLDGRVLFFTVVVSALAAVLFGLVPGFKAARPDLHDTLKEGGRGFSGARHRTQGVFVAMEMALALVLLIGAGLMIRSLSRLWGVNPGFDPRGVLTFGLSLPPSMATASPEAIRATFRQVEHNFAAMPGMQGVSLLWGAFPMSGDDERLFWLDGRPKPANDNEMNWAIDYIVSPDYLKVMHIPLDRGRFFSEQDDAHAPLVAVVDDVFAHKFFPNQDAIGKRLRGLIPDQAIQIVGVVRHVKQWGLDSDAKQSLQAQLYLPFMQIGDKAMAITPSGVGVAVRSSATSPATFEAIRRASQQMNQEQVVYSPQTAEEIIASSLASRRFFMILLGAFSLLALVLASIGIYGVISYVVGERTHEIGVRMALGAQKTDILRMIIGQAGRLALAGTVVGMIAALMLTRLLSGMLYGVSATDPFTFGGIAVLLMLIALAACYIPARRAAKVDPMVALRYE